MPVNANPFVGRKKEAVARCNFYRDAVEETKILINDEPVDDLTMKLVVSNLPQIFHLDPMTVRVWVRGGGEVSQSMAALKAMAIGLTRISPGLKPVIKKNLYCWYDTRIVERKKFGRRKARRGQQWVKR